MLMVIEQKLFFGLCFALGVSVMYGLMCVSIFIAEILERNVKKKRELYEFSLDDKQYRKFKEAFK